MSNSTTQSKEPIPPTSFEDEPISKSKDTLEQEILSSIKASMKALRDEAESLSSSSSILTNPCVEEGSSPSHSGVTNTGLNGALFEMLNNIGSNLSLELDEFFMPSTLETSIHYGFVLKNTYYSGQLKMPAVSFNKEGQEIVIKKIADKIVETVKTNYDKELRNAANITPQSTNSSSHPGYPD